MRAMILRELAALADNPAPLELVDLPTPTPAAGEVLLQVHVCGVCHTELDEIEGRTAPPRLPIVLGHQVVATVAELGAGATRHRVGDRVGVGWIYHSDGSPEENLSDAFQATGRDANGGYAEFLVVPEDYAYPIPEGFSNAEAAPLLCAGAVGYRALRLCNLADGAALGFTGFGASAHLVLQMARHRYPHSRFYVFARSAAEREFALSLGAAWAGDTHEKAPEPLDAIIDTTPAWKPVVMALANLRPGGRLVINAIRKEDRDRQDLLHLSYHEHLWLEREIKSVANVTQFDVRDCLSLAAAAGVRPTVTTYPLADANHALVELKQGHVRGAKVLEIGGE
ncbi:MAG: alcohol dehydrogenase catalytic domain-containing protein [Planctomycetales bacterium]|nr:alcohol dehydrogenase catalytic domain-containing protein [Planctomycetales bacterium]